jgi:hypothetical protein
MKSKLFFLMLLTAVCAVFTSCSKDDDDNYAKAISGTYKGQLTMAGATIVPNAQIVITADGDKQITLKMQETVLTLNVNIACKSDVTYKDKQYVISGSTTFNMETDVVGFTVPVPVKVDGTIDKQKNANIHIHVDAPGVGTVEVIYDGRRQ